MVSASPSSYREGGTSEATPECRDGGKGDEAMRRYTGGESVDRGTYWNLRYGSLVDLKGPGVLPGERDTVFYRVPFSLLFCMVLGLGAVYVLLLPLLMIGTGIYVVGRRVFGGVVYQARKSVMFGWRPTEAYLSGRKKAKENDESHES